MPAIYHFGLNILFDGYLTGMLFVDSIMLIISDILFDGYLIGFIRGKNKSTP
jgi:hypothetical protein